jgi:ribose transport system ATP-binding protein
MGKEILFETKDLSKNFAGNYVLKNVSVKIHCGEIVGLVGENGAGKSTLLNLIMGIYLSSGGTMNLRGEKFVPQNPRDANLKGVGMVFQEQAVIANLTVAQNIFFGDEKRFSRLGFINYKEMSKQAKKIMEDVNIVGISPEKYVRDINFATRQMVEIAKVVNHAYSCKEERALILLDEPTSVLNDQEREKLFAEVYKLAENGHSVIFVSHHLDEVLKITERIYVFKDGVNVNEFITEETTETMLYEAMLGKSSTDEYYYTNMQRQPSDEIVLEARNLSLFGVFKDISFKLHKGEILGICGVVGSGKEELSYVLCGDMRPSDGELLLYDKAVVFRDPATALNRGVLMIPQERNIESVIGILSVAINIAASNLRKLKKWGIVSRARIKEQAAYWTDKLRIKTPDVQTTVDRLSGGNAQKVVFARMLASKSGIVLLNHPTRGVDVGAKKEIYRLIREMVDSNKSIILLGDTLDECIEMSNRILVMMDGVISGEFDAPIGHKPEQLDVIHCMM